MIKHYGFSYPPVGIIDVLKQLELSNNKFYIIDPFGGVELPYHELDADCYVIITTNEGASHRWFDRLIDRLQTVGIPLDHMIIRSCCLRDTDSPVSHIHTIVDECSDFITKLKNYTPQAVDPTHHFVCLNHLHRWQRYQLVKEILDRELDQFGYVSYLQKPNNDDSRFPLVIDQTEITWEEQRNITMPALTGALFNIICETAYEPEPGITQLTHHHSPGMTEKSYKCFALFQIPVWLAPYRAVACYRELGFDVFDDIVDHSYDLESDPVKRIRLIANQIENLVKLNQLTEIKTKLIPRFEKNWQQLKYYAHNFSTELPQWKVLFSGNDPI